MTSGADAVSLGRSDLAPGTLLGNRYRVVSLLGRGGMGEVYRAEDLKLGEDVALKFLPVFAGELLRERFLDEVRLGRRVAHPAVCRTFDLIEADGRQFITMQYVDGEDLASLMRRVGQLPRPKALELARDICAGLAAAHALGIVHRDLKPANIMVDGRGNARITDFGLAALTEDLRHRRERAGTPSYMAPEQIRGEDVGPRSDLYALGLILCELFTGQRLIRVSSPEEALALHADRPPTPSSLPQDIDPALARIILSCLEQDPERRPASASAILETLPGGDPLQAAVASGETPSPEMVAAAQIVGTMRRPAAWSCLVAAIAGLLVVAFHAEHARLERIAPIEKPPAVLEDRATEIIAAIGPPAAHAYSVGWLETDEPFVRYLTRNGDGTAGLRELARARPGPAAYVYRRAPGALVPRAWPWRVTSDDPPMDRSGMVSVVLDRYGRLVDYRAIPPARAEERGTDAAVNWDPLFEAAGLELADWQPDTPVRAPIAPADLRVAWLGAFPERSDIPLRIEATAFAGLPTSFRISGPWNAEEPERPTTTVTVEKAVDVLWLVLFALVLVGGGWLAYDHHRRRRGDLQGSVRLAAFVLCLLMAAWLLGADHTISAPDELRMFIGAAGYALYWATFCWVCYFAFEPFVRRRWPFFLIAWKRLLQGRFADALIGREVLVGMLAGVAAYLVRDVALQPNSYSWVPLWRLGSLADTLSQHLLGEFWAIKAAFLGLFLLLVLRLLLRHTWLAILVGLPVFALAYMPGVEPIVELPVMLLYVGIHVFVLFRFGFLAMLVTTSTNNFIEAAALTLDPGSWYFGRGVAAIVAFVALAVFSFRTTTAGSQQASRASSRVPIGPASS